MPYFLSKFFYSSLRNGFKKYYLFSTIQSYLKAQKETKIHEECLNTISKERSSPREQLIELVNDLNDKEKTQNKCTEIYKMDFTSPNTESCFTGSDEKTKRTYNFCIPEPIASSCSTEVSFPIHRAYLTSLF